MKMLDISNIIENDGKPQPEGRRLEKSMLAWDDSSNSVGVTITVDREVKYQQIIGYVANTIAVINFLCKKAKIGQHVHM